MSTQSRIGAIGEYYDNLLMVDATIRGVSVPQQAASLLCAKLQERATLITARLKYLAAKRGVTSEALWLEILKGNYQELTDEEMQAIDTLEAWQA